ncbi:hypothetical protein AB0M28_02055, partial [Streptomyces sp. NPDC051940]|uniref:hypothetical protein n=1 Tax=Streptomyces sp. NPDC051940 TaxID=3155675 RepID=UPI003435AFE5
MNSYSPDGAVNSSRPDGAWIERYFIDPPDPAQLQAAQLKMGLGGGGAVLGLLMLVVGDGGVAFLGFVGLVAGVVFLIKGLTAKGRYDAAYAKAYPRPSDADIDAIIGTDAFSIVNRALPQLGITPDDLVAPRDAGGTRGNGFADIAASVGGSGGSASANQMVVQGPAMPCRTAVGEDGRIRFSRYSFMVICPTAYHLAIYRCVLDLYTGGLTKEETSEFHYNDVVAVRTESKPLFQGGIMVRPSQLQRFRFFDTVREMQIVVSSGDRASIATRVASSQETSVDGSDALDFPDVLRRVRAMLRVQRRRLPRRGPRQPRQRRQRPLGVPSDGRQSA